MTSDPLRLRKWRAHGAVVEITHTRDLSPDGAEERHVSHAVNAYIRALADYGATHTTDDGETLSTADLIARIIDPVSFENVRQGGKMEDAEWRCNRARDKAAHILALIAERLAGVEAERDEAWSSMRRIAKDAFISGAAADAVREDLIARATAAEAERDAALAKLAEAREVVGVIGRIARSDGNRTFDDCIRDLGLIDDRARAFIGSGS